MSRSVSAYRVPMPAPTNGVDFRIPVFDMPETYSPFLFNMMSEGGYLKMRPPHGDELDDTLEFGSAVFPIIVPVEGGTTLDVIGVGAGNNTWNGTTSVSTPTDVKEYTDYTIFNDLGIFSADSGTCQNLNLSAVSWASGLTYSPTGSAKRKPICSYRERVYMGVDFNLFYGGVGATSGAMTAFSVANFMNGDGIQGLAEISLVQNDFYEQYLVLVSNIGEVLVYSGANPASTDWGLVAKFKVDIPMGGGTDNITVDTTTLPNDVLINAKNGWQIYSVREMMQTGRQGATYSLMEPLRPFFDTIQPSDATNIGSFYGYKSIVYYPHRNSLLIDMNFDVQEIPLFDAWDAVNSGLNSYDGAGAGHVLFLLDLGRPVVTIHSLHNSHSSDDCSAKMVAAGNNVYLADHGAIRSLFRDLGTNQGQDDYNSLTSTFYGFVVFPPPRSAKYRNKRILNLISYSNQIDEHSIQWGINKNFNVRPGTLIDKDTALTDIVTKSLVIPGGQIGNAPVVHMSITNGTPSSWDKRYELYGIDMLYEEGGEY